MEPLRLFRLLILADAALTVAAGVVGAFGAEPATDSPEPGLLLLLLGLVGLVLWIAALIGLWRLRPWARPLYVGATGFGLALYLIPPYYPGSILDDFFSGLTWVGAGALLALMYYSPVDASFRSGAVAA